MSIALLFTRGESLKNWNDTGLLLRETLIYNELLNNNHCNRILWFTYGVDDANLSFSLKEKNIIHQDIFVIGMPKFFNNRFGKFVYSLLLPFIHIKYFKDIKIVMSNQMNGSISGVIAKWFYNKKFIVRCGYEMYQFYSNYYTNNYFKKTFLFCYSKLSYLLSDAIILTSSNIVEYVLKKFLINKKKIFCHSNYIDTDMFYNHNKSNLSRIIYVGRISKQKNIYMLLEAISSTNIGLDIVGSGEDFNSIKDYIKKKSIDVKFFGTVPNNQLPRILNKYSIFVLPSFFEGNPKALLEAMSCGLAVIGANSPGINNIIEDDYNGVLFNHSSALLRNEINALISDTNRIKRLGKNARKYAIENSSLESYTNFLSHKYNLILRNYS